MATALSSLIHKVTHSYPMGNTLGLGHCCGYSLLRNKGIMQSISTSGGPVQETGNIGVGKLEGLKEWRSDTIGESGKTTERRCCYGDLEMREWGQFLESSEGLRSSHCSMSFLISASRTVQEGPPCLRPTRWVEVWMCGGGQATAAAAWLVLGPPRP